MVVTRSKNHGNACIMRCDGCLMDISSTVWMQCLFCSIDICLLCFYKNIPIGLHEYTHKYRVLKSLSFPADFPEWEFIEEIFFLDGVIMHGIGNWEDVAFYIGRKTPEEAKTHFLEVFSIEDSKVNEEEECVEQETVGTVQSNPMSKEISGYMPLREDFEIEYSNDAELVVKDLAFAKTDTQLEKEMKEALADSYRRVLIKRRLFRHLIFKKGLLQAKKRTSAEKALCAAGKDLLSKLKPLLKILSVKEFSILFEGLYTELCIKKKIKQLSQQNIQEKKQDTFSKKTSISEDSFFNYLSQKELCLCNSLSITPSVYLTYKETAIINNLSIEKRRKSLSKLFQGISEQKISQLMEFFIKNGWIERTASNITPSSSAVL